MYYPSADTGNDPSDYGDISPLTSHACGFPPDGVVSECCKVHPVEGICGVFWFNAFLYPCAKCNDPSIPTPMEPSTSIEPSMQPSVSTLEGTDCAYCTMYYPSAGIGPDPDPSDYGDISPLTTHACGFPPEGVVSECCKVHPVAGICGVFWSNEFLYPCAKCNDPSMSPSMQPSATLQPSVAPTSVGLRFSLGSLALGLGALGTFVLF
jgi:hypothetical protein